jgi:ATP adenylyltransferase/5',5'''-P-1,P-4-tetraphosphate phosphorylase II
VSCTFLNVVQWLVSYYTTPPASKDPVPATGPPPDPLDPFSETAKLNTVARISPGYTAILNKFNTIRDHTLLVTDDFEPQANLLRPADLLAWYFCVNSIQGVGFYNSDKNAGASQAHKHMQFLPMDVISRQRREAASSAHVIYEDLPVSVLFSSFINKREWLPYDPYQLG